MLATMKLGLAADNAKLKERLDLSLEAIKKTLKTLRERWEVDKYPNFLASAAMTHSAWELMKVRLCGAALGGDAQSARAVS